MTILNGDFEPLRTRAENTPYSSKQQRGEPTPHFILNLPRLGQGPHTLLVRVQSGSAISLPMQLVAAEQSPLLLAHVWLQCGLLLGALLGFSKRLKC